MRFLVVGAFLVAVASVAFATVWDDSGPEEDFVATLPAADPGVAAPTAQPAQPAPTPTPWPTPTSTAEPVPTVKAQLANTDESSNPTAQPDSVTDESLAVQIPAPQTPTPTPTTAPTTAPTPHIDPTPTPTPHTHPDPDPTPHTDEDPTPSPDQTEAPHPHPDPTPTAESTATPDPTAAPDPTPTADPEATPDPTPTPDEGGGSGGPTTAQWEALRQCESGGNYSIVSANGLYRGAYQFAQGTWNNVAQGSWPELVGVDPSQAAPGDQDKMAYRLYDLSGAGPWPVCGQNLL